MKKTKLVFLTIFLLLIFCVGAMTAYRCAQGGQNWSSYENRWLAGFPALSARSLLNGEAFDGLEDFIRDHTFDRVRLLRANTFCEMTLRGRPVVADVVITDAALLPEPGIPDFREDWLEIKAERMAAGLGKIQSVTQENGGVFLYVGVPEQRTALRERYPDWMENGMEYYDAIGQAFEKAMTAKGAAFFCTKDAMQAAGIERCYSAVDHHYNLYGAQVCLDAVCEELSRMGVQIDVSGVEVSDSGMPFVGTYSRKLYDLSPITETLQIDTGEPVSFARWDNGERTDAPLIELPSDGAAYYTAYMGGDMAETILRMNDPSKPKVLLVGDSFTNAMECLLYRGCSELRSLDYRYYSEKTLSDYIADYQPDVVLILRDDISYLQETGNGDLK